MLQTSTVQPAIFFQKALDSIRLETAREQLLNNIADTIVQEYKKKSSVKLNFICTHNSRRSQLAQVWGQFAAQFYKIPNLTSYSGGTAVTAFYRNTVKTLQAVGFTFKLKKFTHRNPVYLIQDESVNLSLIGFSKLYDDPANKGPYIAITTCSSADENCPFIPEAMHRFHLPFNDPKEFDGSNIQFEKYLEANSQIAGEIHHIFKKVKNMI